MARMKEDSRLEELFAGMAAKISQATGSFWTFTAALLIVLVIQHAQNKDMRAIQLKLNELIAAVEGASNRLIDVEDLTDRELEHLYTRFQTLAREAKKVSHG